MVCRAGVEIGAMRARSLPKDMIVTEKFGNVELTCMKHTQIYKTTLLKVDKLF